MFHNSNVDKNVVNYYYKKIKENYAHLFKIEKKKQKKLLVIFWNQFFSVKSKKISAEWLNNISLEPII